MNALDLSNRIERDCGEIKMKQTCGSADRMLVRGEGPDMKRNASILHVMLCYWSDLRGLSKSFLQVCLYF